MGESRTDMGMRSFEETMVRLLMSLHHLFVTDACKVLYISAAEAL